MNVLAATPDVESVPVEAPSLAVLREPDEPYDAAGECMKIMRGLEAIGVLARDDELDSRTHIELMRELLMPTICRLYEELT